VGGSANCAAASNCYAVANAAATRPSTHWDSTAVKTWTLHVGDSFTDVPPTSPFHQFVETLLHRGVTGGCTGAAYCPSNSTTREQMGVFLAVTFALSLYGL